MDARQKPQTTQKQLNAANAVIERIRQPLLDAGITEIAPVVIGDQIVIADGDARFAHIVPEIAARQPETRFLRASLHRIGIRGIKIGTSKGIVYASFSTKRNSV